MPFPYIANLGSGLNPITQHPRRPNRIPLKCMRRRLWIGHLNEFSNNNATSLIPAQGDPSCLPRSSPAAQGLTDLDCSRKKPDADDHGIGARDSRLPAPTDSLRKSASEHRAARAAVAKTADGGVGEIGLPHPPEINEVTGSTPAIERA